MLNSNSPPPTQNKATSTQKSTNSIKISPMLPPSEFGENPLLPGHTGRERSKDGLPMMQPARGLNTADLFSERISNASERTERVEVAVQEIRNDFDSMLPSLLRLVAIEKDIDSLVLQLESLVLKNPDFAMPSDNTPPPSSIESSAAPTASTKPPTPANTNSVMIKKVRTGIHKNAARLVIDVSAPSPYTHKIDQAGSRLVITVPQASWASAAKKASVKNPLIKSWSVQEQGNANGSIITIDMVVGTRLSKTYTLNAANNKNHRIVFDLE